MAIPQIERMSTPAPPKPSVQPRYLALDAYRGFIMLVLVSGGFGLAELAKRRPEFLRHRQPVRAHALGVDRVLGPHPARVHVHGRCRHAFCICTTHGVGCHQNANSSGMSLPAAPADPHESDTHVRLRRRMHFQLINVLAQIGITYFLCYLIMQLRFRWQALIAVLLLAGYWALFVAFPGTEGPSFRRRRMSAPIIDDKLFGHQNDDYWTTVNFITSTVTTLFGVWTGQLFQSKRSHSEKMRVIAVCAVACLAVGLAIHPWNPIVKRICTTSFTLYSAGWVLLMLLLFYWVVEVLGIPQVDFSAGRCGRKFDLHLFGG